MPITKAAKKAVRQNVKRHVRNKMTKKNYRESIKDTVKSVTAKKIEEAKTNLQKAYKLIDLAAKKNALSPQAAARRKSRLARMVAALK